MYMQVIGRSTETRRTGRQADRPNHVTCFIIGLTVINYVAEQRRRCKSDIVMKRDGEELR